MEATFFSKLKVLLAKYNSVMCHIDVIIITQQERRSNLERQQKSRCKFACEAGSTVPWHCQVLSNCMLHLHARVWESNSLHSLYFKRKPLKSQACHWITHLSFHFREIEAWGYTRPGVQTAPSTSRTPALLLWLCSFPLSVWSPWHCVHSRTPGFKQPCGHSQLWF